VVEWSPEKNRENSHIDKARRPEELNEDRSENQSDKDRCTAAVNSHRKGIEEGYSERLKNSVVYLCSVDALQYV